MFKALFDMRYAYIPPLVFSSTEPNSELILMTAARAMPTSFDALAADAFFSSGKHA